MEIPQGRYQEVYERLDADKNATEEMKKHIGEITYLSGWNDINYFGRLADYAIKEGKFIYAFHQFTTGYGASPDDTEELLVGILGQEGLEAKVIQKFKQAKWNHMKIKEITEEPARYVVGIDYLCGHNYLEEHRKEYLPKIDSEKER